MSESGYEIPLSHLQDSDQDAIYQEVADVDDIYDDVDQSQMMMQHLDTNRTSTWLKIMSQCCRKYNHDA